MSLNELYKRGTKLIDVPPTFDGMPLKEWKRLQMSQDFANPARNIPDGTPGTKWREKRIATPMDNYGMKGPGV